MAKVAYRYVCQTCGAGSAKWIGKCPACGSWNTYQEEIRKKASGARPVASRSVVRRISEIENSDWSRTIIQDPELQRALGGGLVPGSVILVGGQPGIGKSTLLLQLAGEPQLRALYISGEESAEQLKYRAARLGQQHDDTYVLTETNLEIILEEAAKLPMDVLIIDSIQTVHTQQLDASPGTVSQVRECTLALQQFAESSQTPVFIIGHITKEGSIAGPKVLEHIVDVVLHFEGEKQYNYRILRTLKNRFGSTDEMGIYAMDEGGLIAVSNPSEMLLSQSTEQLSGSAIAATVEGLRPLLIETQALVSPAVFGTPQRSTTGFDLRRLHMLLAVLEKRCGFRFGTQDVFLNLAGGIKVLDPALDLAVIAALVSSLQDISIDPRYCFAGEVGLSGEIRAVNFIEQRIQEADRLGFKAMYLSTRHEKALAGKQFEMELHYISRVNDLFAKLFG